MQNKHNRVQPRIIRTLDVGAGHNSPEAYQALMTVGLAAAGYIRLPHQAIIANDQAAIAQAVRDAGFEIHYTRLDVDPSTEPDVLMDITSDDFYNWEPEPFNCVMCMHVLEHISRYDVHRVVGKLHDLMTLEGRLHIIVPSLEWAARQVMYEEDDDWQAVLAHLFGSQDTPWQYHKNGWTMRALRTLLHEIGFRVDIARRGRYTMRLANERKSINVVAEQHYVVAVRVSEQPVFQAVDKKEVLVG